MIVNVISNRLHLYGTYEQGEEEEGEVWKCLKSLADFTYIYFPGVWSSEHQESKAGHPQPQGDQPLGCQVFHQGSPVPEPSSWSSALWTTVMLRRSVQIASSWPLCRSISAPKFREAVSRFSFKGARDSYENIKFKQFRLYEARYILVCDIFIHLY